MQHARNTEDHPRQILRAWWSDQNAVGPASVVPLGSPRSGLGDEDALPRSRTSTCARVGVSSQRTRRRGCVATAGDRAHWGVGISRSGLGDEDALPPGTRARGGFSAEGLAADSETRMRCHRVWCSGTVGDSSLAADSETRMRCHVVPETDRLMSKRLAADSETRMRCHNWATSALIWLALLRSGLGDEDALPREVSDSQRNSETRCVATPCTTRLCGYGRPLLRSGLGDEDALPPYVEQFAGVGMQLAAEVGREDALPQSAIWGQRRARTARSGLAGEDALPRKSRTTGEAPSPASQRDLEARTRCHIEAQPTIAALAARSGLISEDALPPSVTDRYMSDHKPWNLLARDLLG